MKILMSICVLVSTLVACQSTFGPMIGMTETQWLRRTLVADVAYMEGKVKAYKSGGAYYYFVDGILTKIDEGMIPPQKIEMEVKSNQDISISNEEDKYGSLRKLHELREDGIITEEEFQAEKQKILESPGN